MFSGVRSQAPVYSNPYQNWEGRLCKAVILTTTSLGLGWFISRIGQGSTEGTKKNLNATAVTDYKQNSPSEAAFQVAHSSCDPRPFAPSAGSTLFKRMGIVYRSSTNQPNPDVSKKELTHQRERSGDSNPFYNKIQNVFHYIDSRLTFLAAAAEVPPPHLDKLYEASAYLTTFGKDTVGTTIYPTKTGEAFLLESLQPFGSTPNILISKLDQKGNLIWRKEIASSKGISCTGGFITTDEGGFICGGSTGNLALVTKFSSEGNVVWSKQFGKANTQEKQAITHIDMNLDGFGRNNLFAMGQFGDTLMPGMLGISSDGGSPRLYYSIPTSTSFPTDPLLKKFRTIGFIAVMPYNSDGRTYFAAFSNPTTVMWSKLVDKTFRVPNPLVQTICSDGSFIVAGTGYDNWAKFVVSKIDTRDGSLRWARSIRCGGNLHEVCALYEEDDGSIILIGKLSFEYITFIIKLDNQGVVQWARKINGEGCWGGSPSPDGSIFAVGNNINDPFSSNHSSFAIKLNSNGTIPNNCSYMETFDPVVQSISLPLSAASLSAASTTLDIYEDAQLDLKNSSIPPQITFCAFPPPDAQSKHLLEIIIGSAVGGGLALVGGIGAIVYFLKKRQQTGYEQIE